jgi:hypothetical protein
LLAAPITRGGVVAEVWRGGRGRQAPPARLLSGVQVLPIDDGLGHRAAMLLARSGKSGAIDAAVVCLAAEGDDILTSDPEDLRPLAEAATFRWSSYLRRRLAERQRPPPSLRSDQGHPTDLRTSGSEGATRKN